VQRMIRADRAAAGVMFSIDTETGFPRVVLIDAAWGLGEAVVQGAVDPDEYVVFKPFLEQAQLVHDRPQGSRTEAPEGGLRFDGLARDTDGRHVAPRAHRVRARRCGDAEARPLGGRDRAALRVPDGYGVGQGRHDRRPLYRAGPPRDDPGPPGGRVAQDVHRQARAGERLASGLSIGDAVATGKVCKLDAPSQADRFQDHAILVAEMTDPDWVPIMARAAAIVTNHGGSNFARCHRLA
jgi:pyruvate, water dikinase